MGEEHCGALTSAGQLLTWGSWSGGALGMGDPFLLEAGQPGGFATEHAKRAVLAEPSLWQAHNMPEVTMPTPVHFDYKGTGERIKKRRYVIGITAAGMHTGALVIDLEVSQHSRNSPCGHYGLKCRLHIA